LFDWLRSLRLSERGNALLFGLFLGDFLLNRLLLLDWLLLLDNNLLRHFDRLLDWMFHNG